MLRPFLSLVVSGAATAVGAWLALSGSTRHRQAIGSLRPDVGIDLLFLLGCGILAIAAASLVIHWLGVFVVGAIHLLLGGLAVLVPTGGLLSGAYSPIYEIASMLSGLDRDLGDGALFFSFSGVEFALGAFLVAAALAVRTRRDSAPSRPATSTIASVVGLLMLAGSVLLLATVGGDFTSRLFRMMQYDTLLALGVALAAVLAGIAGLTLRWASSGVVVVAGLTLVIGLYAFFTTTALNGLPPWVVLTPLVSCGFAILFGASVLVAALVATFAPRHPVPGGDVDL